MTPTEIASTLEQDILSGALPPGTPLGQVDLADRFGVSRIPVRDALAQLLNQGIITAAPNRTATVLKLSVAEIEELFSLRSLLECDLVSKAVPRMTPDDLERIEQALQRSSLEAVQDNWATGDAMFHAALYAPAMSPRQSALVENLRRIARTQISSYGDLTGKTARWLDEHEAMVEACRNGNAKRAQRLMRRHLRGARNLLLKAMKKAED